MNQDSKKRTQSQQNDNPYNICYDHYMDTNAATECTGLEYRPARGQEEWDAYREIFDFSPVPPLSEKECPKEADA